MASQLGLNAVIHHGRPMGRRPGAGGVSVSGLTQIMTQTQYSTVLDRNLSRLPAAPSRRA